MIISVTFGEPVQVHSFEVEDSMKVGELEQIVSAMAGVPEGDIDSVRLVHEGRILGERDKSLSSLDIKDNDLLVLLLNGTNQQGDTTSRRPLADDGSEIERVRQHILNDPAVQAQLRQRQPELLMAALEDPIAFAELMRRFRSRVMGNGQVQLAAPPYNPHQGPLDVDIQRRIEQLIRERRIDENMSHAMEYHPEAFASVTMLYVPCQVNGIPLSAFVDCGAQMTIITTKCAERCELSELIDKRFSGIAKGVGTSKIVGRIHLVQLQLGGQFLACSMSVIEGDGPDMLLGLDMLKRHQCNINLLDNVLVVHEERIPFLPESEIPKQDEQ